MHRYTVLLLVCAPLVVNAQTSAYEDHLVANLSLVDSYQGYLERYPSRPNLAPPQDVPALARAVAEIHAAFNDDHVSEHEVRLREEFEATVLKGLIDQYPVIEERLADTASLLRSGRQADPVAYDFRLARLQEMVEWHFFALPLLLFDGQTPYQTMSRDALALFEQFSERAAPELELSRVVWPTVTSEDLGSTEVVSIAERRRRQEATRDDRLASLDAQNERERAARANVIAATVQAAQDAAQEELAAERARIDALMAGAANPATKSTSATTPGNSSSAPGFVLSLVGLGAALIVAALRGWLPARLGEPIRATVTPLARKLQTRTAGAKTRAR